MVARVVGDRPRRGPGRPIGGGWTRDEGRAALVAAAETCFTRYSVAKTTIGDVAAEAGVSSATVYRYFSGRDELLDGVLVSVTGRVLTDLVEVVDAADSLADLLVDVMLRASALMSEDPILSSVFVGTDRAAAETIAAASPNIRSDIAEFVLWAFEHRPDLGAEMRTGLEPDDLAAHLLRVVFSIAGVGSDLRGDPAAQRTYLQAYVLPALLEERPPLPSADEIDIRTPDSQSPDTRSPDSEEPS